MIAPARVAAYEILSRYRQARADLPTAIAPPRAAALRRRPRPRAGGGDRDRRPALARGARSPHRRILQARRSIDSIRRSSRSCASAPISCSISRACRRRRSWTMRSTWRGRAGKRSASGLRQRGAAHDLAAARRRCRCRRGPPIRPIARRRSTTSASRCRIRAGSPRAGTTGSGSTRRSVAAVQQHAGAADAARELACGSTRDGARQRGWRPTRCVVRPAPRSRRTRFIVDEGHPLRGRRARTQDWFVVQDEASQLVALLAGAHPGAARARYLRVARRQDHGARRRDGRTRPARRLRCPRSPHRAAAADGRGERRKPNVRLVQADLLTPLPFAAAFDCVLVDAPCSGLGTLRRDPDIRWRRRESRSRRARRRAARRCCGTPREVVAPGGRLIYATCSSEPEENEAVADRVPRGGAGSSSPVDARTAHPSLPRRVVDERGHLRTLPHRPRARSLLRRGVSNDDAEPTSDESKSWSVS